MTPRKRSITRTAQIKARRAQRKTAPEREPEQPARKPLRRIALVVGIAIAALITWAAWPGKGKQNIPHAASATGGRWTLAALLEMKPHQIGDVDIEVMNLLCAEGLPGSKSLDLGEALDRLEEMARRVEIETNRHLYKYQTKPAEYQNSEAYFRMMMLVTVLQQDFGIRYNPARVTPVGVFEPNDTFFADSRDIFIHGLTGPPGTGTCSSLPPMYVAVGRRLKYPLALVTAKNHLFVRWDDGKERLNIEAASLGMNTYPDDHYRQWPYPMTPAEEIADGYLRSLSPAEELAVFLGIRAAALMAAKRHDDSIAAYEHAALLAPEVRLHKTILEIAKRDVAHRRSTPSGRFAMPPDPAFRDDPSEAAWMMYERQQRARREATMPGGLPDPFAPPRLPREPGGR